jgi:hypothetical protein
MTGVVTPAEPRRRTWTYLEIAPVALVVVAEAAWVSVVGGFIQEVRLQAPILGIPILTAFVAVGVIAARGLGPRLGGRWPVVGLGLSLSAGLIGWLLAPEARAALVAGDLRPAIGENPGGWVAGLALLRGFANARFPLSEATCARMLRLGIPCLAVIALIGGAVAQPWRGIFLADTLVAAVVFVACGTFALAFARQQTVGADLHVDWRRNRTWVALLVTSVVIASGIALTSAGVIGAAIPLLIGLAIGPFIIIGLVFGTNRRTFRLVGYVVAAAVLVYVIVSTIASARPPPPPPGANAPPTAPSTTDPIVMVGLGGLGVVVALIVILVLIRLWMGQIAPVEADVNEIRVIDRGKSPTRSQRKPRRRRRAAPVDAAEAYLALVEEIERRPSVRRELPETPAEHARRLRVDGRGSLSLDLLAADYALASFGAVDLPAAEDRRAVARWRSLRSRLGRD